MTAAPTTMPPAPQAGNPAAPAVAAARRSKRRSFVTPEGIDLELTIASAGLRLGALVIDLILLAIIMMAFTLLVIWLGFSTSGQAAFPLWMLGMFMLRNFWFMGFEMGRRGATPGKRLVGIRVVARDGGRLTGDAVIARNLLRELEIFLPLGFLLNGFGDDSISAATGLAGMAWTMTLGLFLLFNRDRMRMGDLIAGTWVVQARRAKLDRDLANASVPTGGSIADFTQAELAHYGVFELQELERLLRADDAKALAPVADTISAKIGRGLPVADPKAFLNAYYAALKAYLERGLLFGQRRADKFDQR